MGSITVRQIDDDLKMKLRRRAAETGRSVEGEVRHILSTVLAREDPDLYAPHLAPRPAEGMGSWLFRISRPGYDLELPERTVSDRLPPDFE